MPIEILKRFALGTSSKPLVVRTDHHSLILIHPPFLSVFKVKPFVTILIDRRREKLKFILGRIGGRGARGSRSHVFKGTK